MTDIDTRLVRLGVNEPRAALVEQGLVSTGLAAEFAAALAKCGWSAAKGKALADTVVLLQSTLAIQAEQRIQAHAGSHGELTSKAASKAFIRKLRAAWPMALRDAGSEVTLTKASIESGGTLGQATPKILAYLVTVAPAVKALETWLKPYFGGVSPATTLASCRAGLEQTDTVQENEYAQLPEATQRIYEAKGRLVQFIGDLNRVGQIAFDGEAVTRARFNKDILLRARRHKLAPVAVVPG
jgi:hypothetical protein